MGRFTDGERDDHDHRGRFRDAAGRVGDRRRRAGAPVVSGRAALVARYWIDV
jgi:hypothetical protein